jgi:hypothetical protein
LSGRTWRFLLEGVIIGGGFMEVEENRSFPWQIMRERGQKWVIVLVKSEVMGSCLSP